MEELRKERRRERERAYQVAGPSSQPAGAPNTASGAPSGSRTNRSRPRSDKGRTCRDPFIEEFPIETAGQPISQHRKKSPDVASYLASCGNLADKALFETAELLMTTGLSGKARTRHLKSTIYEGRTPWRDNRTLLIDIDKLPHGPSWTTEELEVGRGSHARVHIVYKRSILDVIRDLIGNSNFENCVRYRPERQWTSRAQKDRVYGEMWTGNWWWRKQLLLRDPQGTIIPVIIASDKTTMSKMSGGQNAYPVYLTIGNISKDVRRKATTHATSILGYLPIDSFNDITNDAMRIQLRGELLHRAMHLITEPLEQAGRTGVEMWCADGRLRRVYPLLAAFVADWPEQSDMACTSQSGCPICTKKHRGRGDEQRAPKRTRLQTLLAINEFQKTGDLDALTQQGLKPWWPWWANLPDADFATCITPDILHQLHKGLFKSHAVKWVSRRMTKPRLDARFAAMTRAQGMRHFKRGISTVKQWTGRETKEMLKQFLPIIVDDARIRRKVHIHTDLTELIRALLDFTYIAHSARLTEQELAELEESLADMHRLKDVLISEKVYPRLSRLDRIPKWHMVGHYPDSIRELGTPDGYNTESPEYLHIVYVKRGWAASNKRNVVPQIIQFCQRMEALRIHRAYLEANGGAHDRPTKAPKAVMFVDDDGDNGGDYIGGTAGGGEEEEDGWYDEEEDEYNDGEGEEGETSATSDFASEVEYPRPEHALALRPTRLMGCTDLVDKYGAPDLVRAIKTFLGPSGRRIFFVPSDRFGVWHKLTLYHLPLSFAPDEPSHHDIIRVQPPVFDGRGRLTRAGVFDSALLLHDREEFGLSRYRAGRVRAIFQLPDRLRHLHVGALAYVELFSSFDQSPSPVHCMHTTTPALYDGNRRAIVLPINDIVLACHLAPRFRQLDPEVQLDSKIDLLAVGRHFFFNHYYNHFTFQLLRYWRGFSLDVE